MKDILQDIVAHTHALGFLSIVKVGSDNGTKIDSMAEDRSVVLTATTHNPVAEFTDTFGMPNLDKLSLHLKNPEYRENAKIDVIQDNRNGETIPTHIHFENSAGDFQNDYRFMNKAIIEEKLKTATFTGATWNVVFEPSLASISRLKLMSAAHSEEPIFKVSTDNGNLMFSFGDQSSHAGEFVFEAGVSGTLSHAWFYPVNQVQSILNLSGDVTMSISDQGAMKITVDSGLTTYDYILPAQSK
jgi:hypothetical protein